MVERKDSEHDPEPRQDHPSAPCRARAARNGEVRSHHAP
jgi:hypothetical protein